MSPFAFRDDHASEWHVWMRVNQATVDPAPVPSPARTSHCASALPSRGHPPPLIVVMDCLRRASLRGAG